LCPPRTQQFIFIYLFINTTMDGNINGTVTTLHPHHEACNTVEYDT